MKEVIFVSEMIRKVIKSDSHIHHPHSANFLYRLPTCGCSSNFKCKNTSIINFKFIRNNIISSKYFYTNITYTILIFYYVSICQNIHSNCHNLKIYNIFGNIQCQNMWNNWNNVKKNYLYKSINEVNVWVPKRVYLRVRTTAEWDDYASCCDGYLKCEINNKNFNLKHVVMTWYERISFQLLSCGTWKCIFKNFYSSFKTKGQ